MNIWRKKELANFTAQRQKIGGTLSKNGLKQTILPTVGSLAEFAQEFSG